MGFHVGALTLQPHQKMNSSHSFQTHHENVIIIATVGVLHEKCFFIIFRSAAHRNTLVKIIDFIEGRTFAP